MERLDQIDLALAATPAVSLPDLIIKLSRLARSPTGDVKLIRTENRRRGEEAHFTG